MENDNVFSLHFFAEISWEGTETEFLGSFRSASDAIMGFFTWMGSTNIVNPRNREAILDALRGFGDVDGVNDVLKRFGDAFDCDHVWIEVTQHKLGEVLLTAPV